MEKEQLLQELSLKLSTGEISPEEVAGRFNIAHTTPNEVDEKKASSFSVTKMLYVLGAAIVVIGIILFVSQVWNDIGSIGRIAVTLGLGLLLTGTGSMLLNNKPEQNIGNVFHFIGGILIPGGAILTLDELNVDLSNVWPIAITFALIFVLYMSLTYIHKNALLTLFAILNGTASVYLTIEAIIEGEFYNHGDLYAYITMAFGLSYILLGYAFREGWNKKLVGVLYFFGITGFLGAAFSQVFDSIPWQIVYFILVLGGLFLAVYMKNRSILIVSTLFLLAHITYITDEYFADSIGWPITLVILGFLFIGLGYTSIAINKKYIAEE